MQNQKGITSLVGIIIILAVAIVAFGGVFAYQYLSKSTCWPYCPNMTDKDREQIKKDASTAGWKTYTSTKYGYKISFQYPQDWKLAEYSYAIVLDKNSVSTESDFNGIRDESAPGTLTFYPDYATSYAPKAEINSEKVNIGQNNSITAIKTSNSGSNDNPFWSTRELTSYLINQGSGQNQILVNYVHPISDTQYDQTINQIFQSLNIDQAAGLPVGASATEGWKTYANTQYGFEFEYNLDNSENRGPKTPKIIVSDCDYPDFPSVCPDIGSIKDEAGNKITDLASPNPFTQEKLTINNIPFCLYHSGEGYPGGYEYYDYSLTIKDKKCFIIFLDTGETSDCVDKVTVAGRQSCEEWMKNRPQIVKQTFSTFKFIMPTNQTAGWKTYTNTQYGFEFNYPSYASVADENGGGFIAAVLSIIVVSPRDSGRDAATTVRIYSKELTPDLYSQMQGDAKNNDFLAQIFGGVGGKGVDAATLDMVKSTFKFTK